MDISKIRRLIKLIQSTDIMEIEVEEEGQTVRISRAPSQSAAVSATQYTMPATTAVPTVAPAAAATPEDRAAIPDDTVVKSPMVGTFYRTPSPEADPFVSEGNRVKKGDILCIIEAMKLMNEIEAEYDGVVEQVMVDTATPVEFGQPLFIIRPA